MMKFTADGRTAEGCRRGDPDCLDSTIDEVKMLSGIVSTGVIIFESDFSTNAGGWEICVKDDETAPEVPKVVSGECQVTMKPGLDCVTSPNFPNNYGNSEYCLFMMPSRPLSVESFDTEMETQEAARFSRESGSWYFEDKYVHNDFLLVNGEKFSGTLGVSEIEDVVIDQSDRVERLDGMVPVGPITWYADADNTRGGWEICVPAT